MHFWRFSLHGSLPAGVGPPLEGFYNGWLVLVSIAVAVLAASAALAVVDRMQAARARPLARAGWLMAGAVAMGGGIWAMHFIGMLAFVLPVPVSYVATVTLASIVPAAAGAGVALHVLSRESVGWRHLLVGGLLMAVGIGTMHYLGMEAMQLNAVMAYEPVPFLLSIVVAYVLSTLALYVRFALKRSAKRLRQPLAALVLGCAVAGMHYTAMASVRFYAGAGHASGAALPSLPLALLVGGFVVFILGLTIASTTVHRRWSAASTSAADAAARHASVLQTMADGLVTFDVTGRIESTNAAGQKMFGYSEDELQAMTVDVIMPGCLCLVVACVPGEAAAAPLPSALDTDGPPPDGDTTRYTVLRQRIEVRAVHRDGHEFPIELSIAVTTRGAHPGFSACIRDITERERANAALVRAKEEAEAGTRAKSEFLATMSHELRTPLNAIIGYSEMLAEDAETRLDAEALADLAKITQAGRHLLALITNVLDLSKIEAGRMDLCVESFDAADVVRTSITTSETLAIAGHNALTVSGLDRLGHVRSDRTKLQQVLLNLIGNACKFTRDGRIHVQCRREPTEAGDEWLTIEVTDSGIGMSPDQVSRLFRQFVQADASTTRRFGGTGLGLAISQRLCLLMGGTITVQSTPRQGSLFSVTLPVEAPASPSASGRLGEQGRHAFASTLDTPTSGAASPRPPRTPGTHIVLVIDDEETHRNLTTRTLEKAGFRTVESSSAREGLRLARTARPDVVVLDVFLPDTTGWALIGTMKNDPAPMDIPVIVLSIVDDPGPSLQIGAVAHLVKPVLAGHLVATVNSVLDRSPETVEVVR